MYLYIFCCIDLDTVTGYWFISARYIIRLSFFNHMKIYIGWSKEKFMIESVAQIKS